MKILESVATLEITYAFKQTAYLTMNAVPLQEDAQTICLQTFVVYQAKPAFPQKARQEAFLLMYAAQQTEYAAWAHSAVLKECNAQVLLARPALHQCNMD